MWCHNVFLHVYQRFNTCLSVFVCLFTCDMTTACNLVMPVIKCTVTSYSCSNWDQIYIATNKLTCQDSTRQGMYCMNLCAVVQEIRGSNLHHISTVAHFYPEVDLRKIKPVSRLRWGSFSGVKFPFWLTKKVKSKKKKKKKKKVLCHWGLSLKFCTDLA